MSYQTTDTTEAGLQALIVASLAGRPAAAPGPWPVSYESPGPVSFRRRSRSAPRAQTNGTATKTAASG